MHFAKKIKARREELGLTDVEVAKRVGVSIHDYSDIEVQAKEVFLYPEIRSVKKICEELKVDFLELFEMQCSFCEEGKKYLEDYSLPRSKLVNKRRLEMGLSTAQIGDRVGFEESAINDMENDPNYLETWPIDYIKDLSRILSVPLQVLLNVKCGKCHR